MSPVKTSVVLAVGLAVVLSVRAAGAEPTPAGDGNWITLFNGQDLSGWTGDPTVWRVEGDYISGKADKVSHNTFLIYERPFTNFVLRAKVMLVKGRGSANSGIQYRSRVFDAAKWIAGGYQADMGEGWWGACYEERGRGVLWKPAAEAAKAARPYDDWNDYEITADGTRIKQSLNGVACGELDDPDPSKRAASGIIALQYHTPGNGFEARFKDIRIRVLP